jgi:hypothetical protein
VDRAQFVRRAVLNSICDDYENLDQVIFRDVAREAAVHGLEVGRADVVSALASLVEQGLARAYSLSAAPPFTVELTGMPSLDIPEEQFTTYFLATREGIEHHLAAE